jgi:hypothetical protein
MNTKDELINVCCDACKCPPDCDQPGPHCRFIKNGKPNHSCHTSNQDTSLSKETLIEDAVKEIESKITDHVFDGSCCYNDNEGGKGHAECRYPYNPGIENPSGKQCLKLKSEHQDLRQTLSDLYAKAEAKGRESKLDVVDVYTFEAGMRKGAQEMKERVLAALPEKKRVEHTHDKGEGTKNRKSRSEHYNQALEEIRTLITNLPTNQE